MDTQTIINIAFGLVHVMGGWILRTFWSEIKGLQTRDSQLTDKIGSMEVLVAGRYVTREELQSSLGTILSSIDKTHVANTRTFDSVFQKLDHISDQLNRKADR